MKYFTVFSISKCFLCCIFWIFIGIVDKIFTNLLPYTFRLFECSNTKLSTFFCNLTTFFTCKRNNLMNYFFFFRISCKCSPSNLIFFVSPKTPVTIMKNGVLSCWNFYKILWIVRTTKILWSEVMFVFHKELSFPAVHPILSDPILFIKPLIKTCSFPDWVEMQSYSIWTRNNSTRDDVVSIHKRTSNWFSNPVATSYKQPYHKT